jgi:hypothetical protein
VRAVVVIAVNVVAQQLSQMALTEYDGVIEQFPPHAADPALGDAVLLRAAIGSPRRFDAERLYRRDDLCGED